MDALFQDRRSDVGCNITLSDYYLHGLITGPLGRSYNSEIKGFDTILLNVHICVHV
jgi:hypothetical protein